MAIPLARVHLAVAHAALPALLPTPPKWKMLPLLLTPPCPCMSAAVLPKPLAKSGRADADKRWDARKTTKPASAQPSASSSSSGPLSADSVVRSTAGHGSSPRKNATTSPPPKPGRADSVERWDAHKKTASPAASSSSSSGSGTSLLLSSSKWSISRTTSADERWDVHKERRPSQAGQRVDDGESSSTSSCNDIDMEEEEEEEEEEEILWKPRAMYAGSGFVVAAPKSSVLPIPTGFLVPVA